MTKDDELVAETAVVLQDLVDQGKLELATKRGPEYLAGALVGVLERQPNTDLADWLVERRDVSEVYVDNGELRECLAPVFARMKGAEPTAKFHPKLAQAIYDAPDDSASWQVYADWLQEEGDPRGEMIVLQMKREADPDDAELARREQLQIKRYKAYFFGDIDLDEEHDSSITLRRGFFDEVHIVNQEHLKTLLSLESSRFMRLLEVRGSLTAIAEVIAEHNLPPSLVELTLGDRRFQRDMRFRGDGDIDIPLDLPRLERLNVQGEGVHLTKLRAPRLRELVLGARLFSLPEDLTALETLRIEAPGGPRALADLFSARSAQLRSVSLTGFRDGRGLLDAVLESPFAPQLQELAFHECNLDSAALERLLAKKDELASLKAVSVVGNPAGQSIIERVHVEWPPSVEHQHYDDVDE